MPHVCIHTSKESRLNKVEGSYLQTNITLKVQLNDKAAGLTKLGKTHRMICLLCIALKEVSYNLLSIFSAAEVPILYSVGILCLLNCITETNQITDGRMYFPRRPYVGQPWSKGLWPLTTIPSSNFRSCERLKFPKKFPMQDQISSTASI